MFGFIVAALPVALVIFGLVFVIYKVGRFLYDLNHF